MIRRLLFVATLGLMATPTLALAHDGGPRGPMRGLVQSLKDVDLTEAQSAELDALIAGLPTRPDRAGPPQGRGKGRRHGMKHLGGPEGEARRAARAEKKAQFLAELSSATPDAAKLHALLDSSPRGAAPEPAHAALDELLGFQATLSEDQRAQWVEAIEARAAERAAKRAARRAERTSVGGPTDL